MLIGYGRSLLIATTNQAMSVPSTGPAFQAYGAKNNPYNHWWRRTFSNKFILWILFKYQQKPSFIIALGFALATTYNRMIQVYWKVFFNTPEKNSSASTTIIFGNPNGTKKSPKFHSATWSGVICFSPLVDPIPNPFIQSRHVWIFWDTSQSGMFPGSQNYIHTTSNGVYDSFVWSICCALWEHEFSNCQYEKARMNEDTYLLTIGHQNHASILNYILC